MPLIRRQVGGKAYVRLIEVILEHSLDGPVDRALLNTITYRDIRDVLNLMSSQIDTLTYKPGDDDKITPLATGYKNLIMIVKSFYWYLKSISHIIEPDWGNVECDNFEEYQMNIYYPDAPHQSGEKSHTTSTRIPPLTSTKRENKGSPFDQFMRGIKRDTSIFPILKEENHFDDWHGDFIKIAESQGLKEVLDNKYTPNTEDSIELFHVKQKFMYSVLIRVLKTDRGKHFFSES